MMSSKHVAVSELKDSADWRDRAAEARTEAEDGADPDLRRLMDRVAVEYDQLASQLEAYLVVKDRLPTRTVVFRK
jgi:hypothetical protein